MDRTTKRIAEIEEKLKVLRTEWLQADSFRRGTIQKTVAPLKAELYILKRVIFNRKNI